MGQIFLDVVKTLSAPSLIFVIKNYRICFVAYSKVRLSKSLNSFAGLGKGQDRVLHGKSFLIKSLPYSVVEKLRGGGIQWSDFAIKLVFSWT